jgi:SAM-dependent methyltransferase
LSPNPQSGAERLALPACKLCGGATGEFMQRNGFAIVRCSRCAFMFALIAPDYDAASIYKDDVYFTSGGECGIGDYDALWRRRLVHFYVPRLDRVAAFRKPARLLDIGCASGYLMRAAQDRGWDTAGVELSPAMRRRAAEITRGAIYGSIEEALRSGERFECVTMFEVIEHLSDPLATMAQVAQLLAPNGILALSTPNCECPGAPAGEPINVWFDPPEHISYFAPGTIRDCLERSGFAVVAIEGLEHYCRAMAGDLTFPPWVTAMLKPFRRGKRLKPGGLLGKLLERAYHGRMGLYRRTNSADLIRTDVLEVYARRIASTRITDSATRPP